MLLDQRARVGEGSRSAGTLKSALGQKADHAEPRRRSPLWIDQLTDIRSNRADVVFVGEPPLVKIPAELGRGGVYSILYIAFRMLRAVTPNSALNDSAKWPALMNPLRNAISAMLRCRFL
jgi:hypothetical protein